MNTQIEAQMEKIQKAKDTVAKKENTFTKKTALVEKKKVLLGKTSDKDEKYWIQCDIDGLMDDLNRIKGEIEEKKVILAKHEAHLEVLMDQERKIESLYDLLGGFMEKTVEAWDTWDIIHRESMRDAVPKAHKEYYELSREERWYSEKGKELYKTMTFEFKSDEEIHEDNVKAVRNLVLDLYNRTEKIVGTVTDWNGLRVSQGNDGFAVINGEVIGTDGTARVKSVLAGGYNIQRLHIRTLVHEVN